MDKTLANIRGSTTLSSFEKTAVIAYRDDELQRDSPTSLVTTEHETGVIATQEYYLGLLDTYRIRRYYSIGNRRVFKTFRLGDLRERECRSRPLMHVSCSQTKDIHGNPCRLAFWSEEEISACINLVLDQKPLPAMDSVPIKGNELYYILSMNAPYDFLRVAMLANLRVFLHEELRRIKLPNSELDLFKTANYMGFSWNMAQVTPNQLVGYQLNDVVVDPQGVISSFHAIGKKISALSAHAAADSLVKGNFRQHGDYLVSASSTPFTAILYDRKYSEVRFNDILLEHTTESIEGVKDSKLHAYYLAGTKPAPLFVRLHLNRKMLCWSEITIYSIGQHIKRALEGDALSPYITHKAIVVCYPQHVALVDILFADSTSNALDIRVFEKSVLAKFKFSLKEHSVRGVSSYVANTLVTTSFVLQEIHRETRGIEEEYMWQVDFHELNLVCAGTPLLSMLKEIDSDAVYQLYPSENGDTKQVRVVVNTQRMQAAAERINVKRAETLKLKHVVNAMSPTPESDETVEARVAARHPPFKFTPLSIINAMGEEEIAHEMLHFEHSYRELLRMDGSAPDERRKLMRAMNPSSKYKSKMLKDYRQTFLFTTGSNLLENIAQIPNIDATRSYPINPSDTYRYYGCEAMRYHLQRILVNSFSKKSKKADPAHLMLVSEVMTHTGTLKALSNLNTLGMNESVLRHATRSRAMPAFGRAALMGSSSATPGVLTSQVVGVPVSAGTGAVEVLPPQ